ncbi:MAG: ABC transporter ATP-binding protein [Planctomycetota bacterium]|jgi:ABC-2 type transport system ATP-binding protein
MSANAPLLAVEGISRSFGKVRAVDNLSFTLTRGGIHGFIGPNGAGKTTTLKIVATLDVPDCGDVVIDGFSALAQPYEARRRLGFMADKFLPYPDMIVSEYLDFFARSYGLVGRERTNLLKAVIGFCGLGPMLTRPTTGLSKGMGQRLHLAKTLLHDPPLLLLDEPAAGLDPRARIDFRELIRELADQGKGILISSHILAELSEVCDSVVVIEAGRLRVAGTTQDIQKGLREHHIVHVQVLHDVDQLEKFLLVQPHVRDVVAIGKQILRFDFTGDESALSKLLAKAMAQGLPIYAFAPQDANLEEVFLRSTEGRLQ